MIGIRCLEHEYILISNIRIDTKHHMDTFIKDKNVNCDHYTLLPDC